MKRGRIALLIIMGIVALSAALLFAEDKTAFQVIVNQTNPVSDMNKAVVGKLFLKKVTQWDNGKSVYPVDLMEGSAVRERFSLEILHREVSSVKSYWQQMIFSGRAVPPPEKASDAEVINIVKSNPNAIGYISAATAPEGVKILNLK